jgi:signal transduction histidine kinase
MQSFSLFFIIGYSKLFYNNSFYDELALTLSSISAIIFAANFFEGRFLPKITNYKELILNTFLLNIVILTSFYHYYLFEYLPYTIVYGILFISLIFNLKNTNKPALIYVVGWSILCIFLFVIDFKNYYESRGFTDIVLVAFSIEAVLFTVFLSSKYSSLKKENEEYEDIVFQQSKLVKTGEMIANITHQFRQPLNNLSYILINLNKKYKSNNLDEVYFDKKLSQANTQIEFLSKTIDDFKEFYTPKKEKESFEVKACIDMVLSIISADLKKHNIEVFQDFKSFENIQIFGCKNEFSQVLLSLISNSIDTLKDIESPIIDIQIDTNSSDVIIKIKDNGKGISGSLEKIFEPYFTTKVEGTGLGLYLVKQIIEESFHGKIEVKNLKEGCIFSLFIEKAI